MLESVCYKLKNTFCSCEKPQLSFIQDLTDYLDNKNYSFYNFNFDFNFNYSFQEKVAIQKENIIMKMKCHNCNAELKQSLKDVKIMFSYPEQKKKIYDRKMLVGGKENGVTITLECPYPPEQELSGKQLIELEKKAALKALKQMEESNPNILKYARKSLGLNVEELAAKFGLDKEVVVNWETNTENNILPKPKYLLISLLERSV